MKPDPVIIRNTVLQTLGADKTRPTIAGRILNVGVTPTDKANVFDVSLDVHELGVHFHKLVAWESLFNSNQCAELYLEFLAKLCPMHKQAKTVELSLASVQPEITAVAVQELRAKQAVAAKAERQRLARYWFSNMIKQLSETCSHRLCFVRRCADFEPADNVRTRSNKDPDISELQNFQAELVKRGFSAEIRCEFGEDVLCVDLLATPRVLPDLKHASNELALENVKPEITAAAVCKQRDAAVATKRAGKVDALRYWLRQMLAGIYSGKQTIFDTRSFEALYRAEHTYIIDADDFTELRIELERRGFIVEIDYTDTPVSLSVTVP